MLGKIAERLLGKKTTSRSMDELRSARAEELPLDQETPEDLETATFAVGCFWGPDAFFGILPGVYRTRVGYCGGSKESPSYHGLGDHTETVQVEFDPGEVSYKELLEVFWQNHSPTHRSRKKQYRAFVFYHNEEQKRLAERSKKELEGELGEEVETEIREFDRFWPAEDYHQKYHLRQHRRMFEELLEVYSPAELTNSTVAARMNGYVTGYGSMERLEDEIDSFGLSAEVREELRRLVERLGPAEKC